MRIISLNCFVGIYIFFVLPNHRLRLIVILWFHSNEKVTLFLMTYTVYIISFSVFASSCPIEFVVITFAIVMRIIHTLQRQPSRCPSNSLKGTCNVSENKCHCRLFYDMFIRKNQSIVKKFGSFIVRSMLNRCKI